MKKALSAIIKEAAAQETIQGKIDYLRANKSPQLVELFSYMYDPRCTFILPKGKAPEYRKIEGLIDQEGRLYVEMRKLYMFCAFNGVPAHALGQPKNLIKREMLFLQILESIDPEDAKMLVRVKDKKCWIKGITPKLVHDAFPEVYIGEEKENVER